MKRSKSDKMFMIGFVKIEQAQNWCTRRKKKARYLSYQQSFWAASIRKMLYLKQKYLIKS